MTYNLSSLDLNSQGYIQAMNARYGNQLIIFAPILVENVLKIAVFDASRALRDILDSMPDLDYVAEKSKLWAKEIKKDFDDFEAPRAEHSISRETKRSQPSGKPFDLSEFF